MKYTILFWGNDNTMLEKLQTCTTQKIKHISADCDCECGENEEILLFVELGEAQNIVNEERFATCFSVAVTYDFANGNYENLEAFSDVLLLSEPEKMLRMRFKLYNNAMLAHSAMRYNHDKYKDFFYKNDMPVLLLDNKGIVIEANDKLLQRLDYSETELYYKPYTNFFQDFDFEKHKKNGVVMVNLIDKNDQLIPKELYISKIFVGDEDVYLISCHNLNEQVNYVQKIQSDEIRFRSVIANSPSGLMIFKDNKITFINERALSLLGGNAEDYLQKSVLELVLHSERQSLEKFIAERLRSTTNANKQFTFLSVNHEEIFVKLFCKSLSFSGENILLFHDISELIKSKELIAHQESYLNEMQTIAKIGHYEVDFKMKVIRWSREMYKIYNLSSEDFKPTLYGALHFVHPSDFEAVKKCYRQAKIQPGIHEVTYRLNLDGKTKWVCEKMYGVFKSSGEAQYMVGWMHDINDSIATKTELQVSQEKYSQLFQNLDIAVLACTIETNKDKSKVNYIISEANEAFKKTWKNVLGNYEDVVNKNLHDIFKGSDEFWENEYNQVYKTSKTIHFKKHIRTVDKTVQVTLFLTPDRKQILGLIEDITDQENALKTASRLTERLKRIQRYARIGTLIMNDKGECQWSNVMYQLFEYNTNVKPTTELYLTRVHPEDRAQVLNIYNKCVENKEKFLSSELRLLFHDGRIKHLYAEMENFYINGKLERSEGWVQDITARRNIELELIKAKEKAEESDRLKSSFLANMSHEIRTPLNAIVGFSTLLVRKNYSEEKRHLFLNEIKTNSRHLLTIINDILDISKIESEQLELSYIRIDLNQLMQEIYDAMQFQIKDKKISLFCQKSLLDSQARIFMDDVRLKQILTNLVSNAIKFTEKGYVNFGYTLKNKTTLEFFVKDTGVGVAPENHKSIFQYFRQEDETITHKFGGTGLGLAISKRLVELMGGEIWIESEKDKGAQFFFTTPYVSQSVETKKLIEKENKSLNDSSEDEANLFHGETILVVDDHESSFVLFAEIFSEYNLTVDYESSGQKGIEYVRNNPSVALIFMDIHMPYFNGVETMKVIKKEFPNIPIVAQTAFALKEDRQKYLDCGFDDYVSKPLNKTDLLQVFRRFLQNEESIGY